MYSHVFVAGTFDQLHKGHEVLLERAFEVGDRVTVGLTSDEFVANFRSGQKIRPFPQRKQTMLDWISARDFENRTELIAIDNPYEPAASMDGLDALMVTPDNRVRGEEINKRRTAKGLPGVELVEVPMIGAQDQQPISASRIRSGEIDTSGTLTMPDSLRPELTKPLGQVLIGDNIGSSIESHRNGIVIAVGDITTKTLLTAGVVPNLSIVDFQVHRKPFTELDGKFNELTLFRVTVKSGPGYISQAAIDLIQKWAAHPADREVMIVDGEEDLLALPAIAYGPEGCVVYYGQPEQGLVEVTITVEKKNESAALLSKFITS